MDLPSDEKLVRGSNPAIFLLLSAIFLFLMGSKRKPSANNIFDLSEDELIEKKFTKDQLLDALIRLKRTVAQRPNDSVNAVAQSDILNDINRKLDVLIEDNASLRRKVSDLEKTVKLQSDIIENHERYFRKNNLIIHGISEDTTDMNMVQMVDNVMYSLSIECHVETDCVVVQRLGRASPGKKRPIRATFKELSKRNYILSKAKNLRYVEDMKHIYINSDLTPIQQSYNRNLREFRNKLRSKPENEGKHVYIWNNSVYIDNQKVNMAIFSSCF